MNQSSYRDVESIFFVCGMKIHVIEHSCNSTWNKYLEEPHKVVRAELIAEPISLTHVQFIRFSFCSYWPKNTKKETTTKYQIENYTCPFDASQCIVSNNILSGSSFFVSGFWLYTQSQIYIGTISLCITWWWKRQEEKNSRRLEIDTNSRAEAWAEVSIESEVQ